jgi:DNA-binding CsgD family transcriptional regulator
MARRYVLGVLAASTVGDRGWTSELYAHAERSTDDPDLRCAAASAVAIARGREGFQRQAMDILQQAAQAFPPRDPATAVGLAVCAAVIAVQSGLPEHLPLVAGMRELAGKGRGDDGTGSISFLVPQDADVQLAYVDVTIDPSSAEQFRDLLPADGRPHPATAIGKLTLAVVADELSETGLAVQLWSGGVRGLGAGGEIAAWPEAWPAMARELIELGRWQEASIALDAAEELDDTQDLPLLRVMVIALRGTLAALRGDGATARALGESVWPLLTFECNGVARMTVLRTLALSAMASGDFDTAYRHYRTQVEAVATARHVVHASHPVLGLAMTAHRAGRTADALPLVEAVRDNYGPDPGVRMRLTLDHAFALLDTDDRTEDRFMSVVTDERAPEWLLDHALARFHFGAWLRRRRRPIEARPHLAAAYTILTDLGAVGLAESARVELRASGGAAAGTAPAHRSGVPGGWALLSPQQREVARLAAQGLRNREIGEQLELSPRTVSTHLYNCYLRLGITARHQLGDVVERQ